MAIPSASAGSFYDRNPHYPLRIRTEKTIPSDTGKYRWFLWALQHPLCHLVVFQITQRQKTPIDSEDHQCQTIGRNIRLPHNRLRLRRHLHPYPICHSSTPHN